MAESELGPRSLALVLNTSLFITTSKFPLRMTQHYHSHNACQYYKCTLLLKKKKSRYSLLIQMPILKEKFQNRMASDVIITDITYWLLRRIY